MTANEIIYAIREKLKAYTDDTRYTNGYLMFLINLKRSLFIRREYNQFQRTIDVDTLQSICMDIEAVDESECPDCGELGGCQIYRTVEKLPKRIELHNRQVITRIAPLGVANKPFTIVSRNRFIYAGEAKHEATFVFATVHDNGYIYLKSKQRYHQGLDKITVTQLFENPDDASAFNCNNETCYDLDTTEYPCKQWMVDLIITEIVKELAMLKELPSDVLNNAKDDTVTV